MDFHLLEGCRDRNWVLVFYMEKLDLFDGLWIFVNFSLGLLGVI